MPEEVTGLPEKNEHGSLYWFAVHTRERFAGFLEAHKRQIAYSVGVIAVLLFLFRPFLQPYVLVIRIHFLLIAVFVGIVAALWYVLRTCSWKIKIVSLMAGFLLVFVLLSSWGKAVHHYFSLYRRYETLHRVELQEYPVTCDERIQPLNSIYSLAHERMALGELPSKPAFVNIGDEKHWTMMIEPAYFWRRLFGEVKEVFNVSATTPVPDFTSQKSRVPVRFDVAKNLLLSHNVDSAVIRAFGPGRFFNYETSDVAPITDDNGEWVQSVALMRWTGVLFPRPEFGGVQIIRQTGGLLAAPGRILFGRGTWVPPEEVPKHKFLVGQDNLSFTASRFMAESFRFQNGFLAPFPGNHEGDIRIPDMPGDVNEQPFTTCFEMNGTKHLYHYFSLEPYGGKAQATNTSLFIPADGTPVVYVYKHFERDPIVGVSTISAKVKASRPEMYWTDNRPVEHRPYIKKIGGRARLFWMTTVVTKKEEKDRFITGPIPAVVLTDGNSGVPVWVNVLAPETWPEQLERELGRLWASVK